MKFEWDENKNLINIKKHGISFERAVNVFYSKHLTLKSDKIDKSEKGVLL